MFFARFITGLLVVSVLLLTTTRGWCAEQNLDCQIAERTQQYQESLRQRAAQLSPSLQSKIEAQAQQTVATGLEKWKNSEIDIQIALPGWAETYRAARFIARYLPFSGSPAGSFAFGNSLLNAAMIVPTVQSVLKSWTIPFADLTIVRPSLGSFRQNGDLLAYFVGIVHTIVQRR